MSNGLYIYTMLLLIILQSLTSLDFQSLLAALAPIASSFSLALDGELMLGCPQGPIRGSELFRSSILARSWHTTHFRANRTKRKAIELLTHRTSTMPKSKRAKVVHTSKTQKKGKELTLRQYANISEYIEQYPFLYVFSVHNMRNSYLKEVRNQLSDSRYASVS